MENSIATINKGRPVYFSYARNSSRKPEWEHISDCVETLLSKFTDNGLEYRVDIKDIDMGDKISSFEQEIGWKSEVVVIIFSDKYFRSMHCMYEFVQIKKALEHYPEKRLMCIKSGDFNLADVNYVRDLERYWNTQKLDYDDIEYHRLREHSGTEKSAWQNGFYIDDIRKLYSFFSAINYSNASNIDYEDFVGDIVKYYKTTPKPDLTPKPPKYTTPKPTHTVDTQTSTANTQTRVVNTPTYIAKPQPAQQVTQNVQSAASTTTQSAKKKITKVAIAIAAAVLLLIIIIWAVSRPKVVKPEDLSHEPYVDLGLPSGTLWATHNVGANAPEEYGDYFAWGETKPKSNYDWSTYKYAKGKYDKLTKYCNNKEYGYNGFTDTRTTLERSDDAATANWGTEWCMPTIEQFKELKANCTNKLAILNGVPGLLITSKYNGVRIFLPAAGYRYNSYLSDVGTLGYYWSSLLYTTGSSYDGRRLGFDFGDMNPGYVNPDKMESRDYGLPVRPVRCKK